MKRFFRLGYGLIVLYVVLTIFLFATAQEMEILLAINFAVLGLAVVGIYYIAIFVAFKVPSGRRILLILLAAVIVVTAIWMIISAKKHSVEENSYNNIRSLSYVI